MQKSFLVLLYLTAYSINGIAQAGSGNVPVDNNNSYATSINIIQNYVGIVTAEKMNVLYVGVDNPIAISVPSLSEDKIQVRGVGSGLVLRNNSLLGSGHYIANVTTVGICTISVEANESGKIVSIGNYRYRVKRVPDPVATIANRKGGTITKDVLATGTLIPMLENFDFELFFKIVGFKMIIIRNGQSAIEFEGIGNQLTQTMKDELVKTLPGDRVLFQNIKATMTSEENVNPRNLQPLIFLME